MELKRLSAVAALLFWSAPGFAGTAADPQRAADLTADQVAAILAKASAAAPADLSGHSLKELDLSGFNFKGALLRGVNLFGAKLVDADLSNADLSGANLNLCWLIHANLSGANLTGASIVAPVVSEGLDPRPGELPILAGADMTGARLQVRLPGGSLTGAKFAGADLAAHRDLPRFRTELGGAKLDHADFSRAKLGHVDLSYADVRGATFRGADLSDADLSGLHAEDADFTGANLQGADMENADMVGAKGLADQTAAPSEAADRQGQH